MVKDLGELANKKIQCGNCNQEFALQDGQAHKEFESGLIGIGLECPHCHFYIHSFFQDDNLRKLRQSVNRALALFKKEKTQKRWQDYLRKRDNLNTIHDEVQQKYAHLLEVKNG